MDRLYLRGFAQRQDNDDGPLRFIVATEGKKADGLDLRMDGLDLDRFRANPVVMYGHDYFGRESLPIGRAENLAVDGPNLEADTIFDPDDDFAQRVEAKYRGGFLNAVSVGFDIRGFDPETGVVDEWEMIEYSAVPIPLDPDAVVAAGRQRAIAFATALTEARDGNALDAGHRQLVRETIDSLTRLLQAPIDRTAIQSHSTSTVDTDWDGPAAEADAPNDESTLRHMHAWRDPDGDPEAKATYRFPHHAAGDDTAANLNAVRNALSRLPQADIPDADRDGVEAHLRRHLEDAEDDDRGRSLAADRLVVEHLEQLARG